MGAGRRKFQAPRIILWNFAIISARLVSFARRIDCAAPIGRSSWSQPMKKALITGITGQDGAYLAEFLLGKGTSSTA